MSTTNGRFTGEIIVVRVGANTIGCTTSDALSLSAEEVDLSCKDDGLFGTTQAGKKSWSLEISGWVAYDATYGNEDLKAAWLNSTVLAIKYGTVLANDPTFEGNAVVTSYEESAPDKDGVSFTATLSGRGTPTLATNP